MSEKRTVLVVDDIGQIRQLVQKMLQDAGYEVLVAESGRRALQLVQNHPGTIHLLVCHWMMHSLNGPSLGEVLAVCPDINIVLMSASDPDPLTEGNWTFLRKHFDRIDFVGKVRDLLPAANRSVV